MSTRLEHDDDGNDNEMSSLQSGSKPYEGSQGRLHHDSENQSAGVKKRNQEAAYRKLYAIVTIMTLFLFGLNITQVCLLPVISNLYWIVLFPGIIFLAFTTWGALFVSSNKPLLTDHLGEPHQGWSQAFQHLGALFKTTGRSARASEQTYLEPNCRSFDSADIPPSSLTAAGPRRFERAGIFLTIYLNIILTQFIYLPVFAVPAFKEITWKMELNSSYSITTPSFALVQNTELKRRAALESDATSIQQLCDEKERDPVFENLFCFKDWNTFNYGPRDENHTAAYVTFNANQFQTISQGVNMGLWYQYSYNRSASRDPLLSIAAFDTKFVDHFKGAFNCGIIPSTAFPAGQRVQATLRPVTIDDPYNAMRRKGNCTYKKTFEKYNMYEVDVTPLGSISAPGGNNCDLSDENYNGSCNADITIQFPSTLTRVYTSRPGKDWITILTEEGGVVGFVTFLTWFFGIFKV